MTESEYSFILPRWQLFSFPSDVISSMLEKPSSHKGLMKLYQTCKYFYGKRPILISSNVKLLSEKEHGSRLPNAKLTLFLAYDSFYGTKNIAHLKIPVWASKSVYLECSPQRLSQFFRFSLEKVWSIFCDVQYEDFVRMTAEKNVKDAIFHCGSYVCHSDGSKATIYELLQHLPKIEYFIYFIDETCTLETLEKLIVMKFDNKFSDFRICFRDLHPSFDLNLFCEFFKKNSTEGTYIFLHHNHIEATKEKLQNAIEKLDPKWKKEAHKNLTEYFEKIYPNWEENLEDC